MKKTIRSLFGAAMLIAASTQTYAQGLVYDQQTANAPSVSGDYFNIQSDSPLLQSFVPALSAIGFARLQFTDAPNNGTNGATVYVSLWTGSPNTSSATFLGSTTPVFMPNGFGSSIPGVTNFYFSTLIPLTAGQTYYLQPVVLSGDNPFDIKVLGNVAPFGDYYSAGDLYSKGTDTGIDLWFGEGIVSVPEPSTLILVVVAGVLVFVFKRRSKLIVPLLFAASVLSVQAAPDSIVQATADEAGLTPVSATALPRIGTFWVMLAGPNGRLMALPYPILPPDLSVLPIYSVAGNAFIVDDTGGQISPSSARRMGSARAASIAQTQAATMAALIDQIQMADSSGTNQTFQPDYTPQSYGSNNLWLSITLVTNGISYLEIHPPWNVDVDNTNWDLFYTTNLTIPFSNWWWILTTDIGQTNLIVPNATDAEGFYALGLANTNGRPTAFGDLLIISCPNTSIDFALTPSTYPSYTILTHPTNGVLTGTPPYLTYAPNPCYEGGQDSFTYKANDGTNDSAPATVAITINADPVYANSVSAQTCRGTAVGFTLSGGDNCGETLNYALLSNPLHGTVTNVSGQSTDPNYVYTPTGTNFTGTDTFNYIVYSGCGDTATNTVTITVGDEYLNATPQTLITGTNQTVAIILSAADNSDACIADTNYYTYTIVSGSGPTHGTLTGTPPNLTYKPNTNYEGLDSFQFTASDGVWTSSYPATITIDVTAGPILFRDCNPFGTAVKLAWMLDTNEQVMFPNPASQISDFIVYRSAHSGGPYTAIATNGYTGDLSWMSYLDTNAVVSQTNYYVVTFQAADSPSGVIVESPRSNEIKASGQNLNPLIPPDAIWSVVTNRDNPSSVTNLQAPFSSYGTNQYPGLYPLPHTLWPVGTTWTNHITMFIPTNSVPLAQVTYSIAIDNQYWLYVNGAYVGTADNNGGNAVWSAFQPFPTNTLHYGTNNIVVGIQDWGNINYFSMIVFTNTCGW